MSSVLSKISEGLGYSAVSDSQPPPEDREKCADSDAASDKQGSSAKNDTEASTRSPSKALSDEETHSGTAPPSELSSSQCSVDPLGVGTFPSSSGNTNHQTESLDLKPLPGSWGPDDDPQLRTSSEDWLSHGRCSQYPTHRAGGPSYMAFNRASGKLQQNTAAWVVNTDIGLGPSKLMGSPARFRTPVYQTA
uniref:Uncharacterized protein n=1 Tax=Kwoniella bestiolae CBS 10118 TaxID=1296100 RepID=A0A1B9G5W0_9TREE|nr:hypothetical protein I302_04071 [Kwoniella bestiolae CBS 10118]OCF26388.1 hypothetical protein I302_04071 [Kwoniella bestiolae CBS 10118]